MINMLPLQNLKKKNCAERIKRAYLALTKDWINEYSILKVAK